MKKLKTSAEDLRKQVTIDSNGNEYYKGVLLDPSWENNPYILGMYSFDDEKQNKFDTPFFCQNDMMAKRHYIMVTEETSMIARFKEDFNLVRLGCVDLESGDFTENRQVLVYGTKKETETK